MASGKTPHSLQIPCIHCDILDNIYIIMVLNALKFVQNDARPGWKIIVSPKQQFAALICYTYRTICTGRGRYLRVSSDVASPIRYNDYKEETE